MNFIGNFVFANYVSTINPLSRWNVKDLFVRKAIDQGGTCSQ